MKLETLYKFFLECNSICTDTRKITKDCLFFALKGDNFNGNSFAKEALKKGAKYCIIDEKQYYVEGSTIIVNDVLETLQELAKFHRKQLGLPIIALTGSNGKTTTKELINIVLNGKYKTSATIGNLNNHIGVPLTLLAMDSNTEIGVVEMGANHQKEIEFLCDIAQPDYGLITNFGKAHLEGFGGFEGVIKGKSELYNYLIDNNKLIFINGDDDLQLKQINSYDNRFTFGQSDISDTKVKLLDSDSFVKIAFNKTNIKSHLIGNYNFNNIAAAIAIGSFFKVSSKSIKKAIEAYVPDNNRSQIIEQNGHQIILDAYNANPTSMMAALNNFKNHNSDSKIIILGDMFELGNSSKKEHQFIIDYVEQNFSCSAFFVGEHFYKSNIKNAASKQFIKFEDFRDYMKTHEFPKSSILIKGSRGMALERLLKIL